MKNDSYYSFFINFSSESKLKILLALKNGPMNVSSIVKAVNEEQSAVSHNLKKLAQCSIVKVQKKGKERIYSLNGDTVAPLMKIVEKHIKGNCSFRCPKCKK